MVRKPYDLNVHNISYLSFHDIGIPQWIQRSLLELEKVFPKEETNGLPHTKGLKSENLNFLILPTNLSSHDDDCTYRLLEELVPKKEVQPLSSSSIALVP